MKLQIAYSDLIRLNHDIIENVKQLIEHGAEKVELMMDAEKWNEMEELFEPLAEKLRQFPVTYSVHPPAWDINLTSENKAIRQASFDEYVKAIRFASMIEASHVVIHPGFCFSPVFNKEKAKVRAIESIKELCAIAEPLHVQLAIENVGYKGTSLFTQEEYVRCLDGVSETAGYLIDVGHAQLDGWTISEAIYEVKDRLVGLHLHDNNGTGDDHLPITEGIMDWDAILSVLNVNDIDCELILEYAPETPLEKLRAGKEYLNSQVLTGAGR